MEAERKTARKMTAQKVQDVAADQFRKNDKFTKKAKGTDNTSRQTLHKEVEQDEAEAAADGDVNNDLSSNLWPGGFLRSRRLPVLL